MRKAARSDLKQGSTKMKLRLLIVILLVAALFSGVVLWRVDRFVYGDRMAWAEAQARSQISSLNQAIRSEIESARRMLASVNSDTFKRERTNWRAFQPYYAVALMTTKNGSMAITQMTSRRDTPAESWTPVQLGQYIGFMGKELEKRGTVLLRSFKDPNKNTHVALIFAGGGHAYILVGNGGNFQSLIESQKGSLSSIAIVASDGLTISHATPEYIGTVMGDSSLLKEIRSTGSAHGLGTYMQGKKQVFGMYDQVPGSSAYVISTVPIEELLKGRMSLAWQFVFLAVGFCLIGSAVYFWYEKQVPRTVGASAPVPASSPVVEQKQEVLPPIPSVNMSDVVTTNTALVAPVAPKNPPPKAPPPAGASASGPVPAPVVPPDLQQEKAEAYRQVAAAMGQEMRAPLASILGFSQMVLSKTQEPEVVQAVESILREARSSRDVLEKLVTFSGERNTEKSLAKIEGPLMQALKNLDALIQQKGVQIEKDFQETSPWPLASEYIAKAFESFFENAIESMERMQAKTLKISVWESSQGLHVRIVDTGEGIERENLGKVFDPFFTTRSYANHVGLGLPVAAGILKEHQAQVKIQSQRSKGTQVDIVFAPPLVEAAVSEAVENPSAPTLAAEELPTTLPQVSAVSEEERELTMAGSETPREKLTDINVDSLLELPPEDPPLQFLEGMGFEPAPPPPVATPPVVEASPPTPPPLPPPAPPPTAPPPAAAPSMEEESLVISSVVIDAPTINRPSAKSSELDSYKVEVRRPGKRN